MILVGQYDSPYVRRVAIALTLVGMQFTRDTRSVFTHFDEMRRINPLGRIPSLVLDDGEVLVDSSAILDWIDEQAGPDRALLPARGVARRRALQICALATGVMEKAMAIVFERLLRPPEKQHAPWLDRCQTQLAAGLDALEGLDQAPWLMGERMSTPDITVGCVIAYLRLRVPDAFPSGRYPRLEALSSRAEALPVFQATRSSPEDTVPSG